MAHPNNAGQIDSTFKAKSRSTWEILRRVAVYLKPYKLMSFGTMGCALLSLVFAMAYPAFIREVIDDVIGKHQINLLTPVMLALIGSFLLRDIFNSLRIRINNTLEQNVIFDMRRDVYARLQRLPVNYFDQRASGDLMTRVIEDVNSRRTHPDRRHRTRHNSAAEHFDCPGDSDSHESDVNTCGDGSPCSPCRLAHL